MSNNRFNNKSKLANGHDYYMHRLIDRLSTIDEYPDDIHWIMPDGVWTPRHNTERTRLCDLILIYHPNGIFPDLYDGYGIPVELKGNKKKFSEAKGQIIGGKNFINECLDLPSPYGKFVVYNQQKDIYDFTVMEFD